MLTDIFVKDGVSLVFAGRWEWTEDAKRAFEQARLSGAAFFQCMALPSYRIMRANGGLAPGAIARTLRFEILHRDGAADNITLVAQDEATIAVLREDVRRFRNAA